VTIIHKKQKKQPNLPTLSNMKVEKRKEKGGPSIFLAT
jgi:hypothetical protein